MIFLPATGFAADRRRVAGLSDGGTEWSACVPYHWRVVAGGRTLELHLMKRCRQSRKHSVQKSLSAGAIAWEGWAVARTKGRVGEVAANRRLVADGRVSYNKPHISDPSTADVRVHA